MVFVEVIMEDVIIVGGGPAGLSAALILGRCRRKVLLFDNGRPRNAYSNGMHGYLSRDGISPQEFLTISTNELKSYPNVRIINAEVTEASKSEGIFHLKTADEKKYKSKKLLIATGVVDSIPVIDGIGDLWGKTVFTCPYCDGWEFSDRPLAVFGKNSRGLNLSIALKNSWSRDVILFTHGPSELSDDQKEELKANEIPFLETKIRRLVGTDGKLEQVELEDGSFVKREALFFNTPSWIRSKLLDQLGCPFTEGDGVETGKYERTKIPGLFVAGNILRNVQLAIVAAAEGAEAAFGINVSLCNESRIKADEILYTPEASPEAHQDGRA